MKFKEIEDTDLLEDVPIYWASLSDMPEEVQSRAREIDGEEYDFQGFGMCLGFDFAKKEFFVFSDKDTATGGNVYYVDKDGYRNWFQVDIEETLTKQIFDACERINAGIDTPQGYSIQKTAQFGMKSGFVLAKKDDAAQPFIVWAFSETLKGYRNYNNWKHGYKDERTAEKAFAEAVAVYTAHERTYHSPTAKAAIWGAAKKPSIKERLAAKPVPGDKPAAKSKDREVR